MDDGSLASKSASELRALNIVSSQGLALGFNIHLKKCEQYGAGDLSSFPSAIQTSNTYHQELLGAPIGDSEYCSQFLHQSALALLSTLEKIGSIDPQVALALLRLCSGFSKLIHIARVTPPHLILSAMQRYDADICHSFANCTGVDTSDTAWKQAKTSRHCDTLSVCSLKDNSPSQKKQSDSIEELQFNSAQVPQQTEQDYHPSHPLISSHSLISSPHLIPSSHPLISSLISSPHLICSSHPSSLPPISSPHLIPSSHSFISSPHLIPHLIPSSHPLISSPHLIPSSHPLISSPHLIPSSHPLISSPHLIPSSHPLISSPHLIPSSHPLISSPHLIPSSHPLISSPHLIPSSHPLISSPHLIPSSHPLISSPHLIPSSHPLILHLCTCSSISQPWFAL
ncbi:hypothetical protein EMCRGX_G004447 [Ephydatia muelleri]